MHYSRGQISLMGVIIGGITTVLASGISAIGVSNNQVANVRVSVAEVDTREKAHYDEVQKQYVEIGKRLDAMNALLLELNKKIK